VAYLTTPLSIKVAYKLDIIDRPRDDRRVHNRPIPRFGGMGIFLGSMAALIIPAGLNSSIRIAMLGGMMMYGIGVADDILDLKPMVKFAGQLITETFVYAMGIRIRFINVMILPAAQDSKVLLYFGAGIAYVITVLWIVGITNAVNLMDGLDGLAAGSTAIMALSLAYVAYIHGVRLGMMPVCVAFCAVAAGCLGFLPYNFSPAKTFMGDGGSLYLGYMIAVLSVISPLKRATFVGAIIPMLVLAVPIFDTAFAMVRRMFRHESIMKADRGHLHHHLMAAGFGQRRSVLIMYGIVGIMGVVAVLISRELYTDAFCLFTIAMLYLGIIIVPKQPKKKSLKRILTQDPREAAREQERENLVWMLNTERERRRAEREAAGEDPNTQSDLLLAEIAKEAANPGQRATRYTVRLKKAEIERALEQQEDAKAANKDNNQPEE
jgi:UDP-GlcNAc:undecaprenyl-phosphate GlcNAc-1-phosphate transferase